RDKWKMEWRKNSHLCPYVSGTAKFPQLSILLTLLLLIPFSNGALTNTPRASTGHSSLEEEGEEFLMEFKQIDVCDNCTETPLSQISVIENKFDNEEYHFALHRLTESEKGFHVTEAILHQYKPSDDVKWFYMTKENLVKIGNEVFDREVHLGSSVQLIFPVIQQDSRLQFYVFYFGYAAGPAYPIVQIDQREYYDWEVDCHCKIPPCDCFPWSDGPSNTPIPVPPGVTQTFMEDRKSGTEELLGSGARLTDYMKMLLNVPTFQRKYISLNDMIDINDDYEDLHEEPGSPESSIHVPLNEDEAGIFQSTTRPSPSSMLQEKLGLTDIHKHQSAKPLPDFKINKHISLNFTKHESSNINTSLNSSTSVMFQNESFSLPFKPMSSDQHASKNFTSNIESQNYISFKIKVSNKSHADTLVPKEPADETVSIMKTPFISPTPILDVLNHQPTVVEKEEEMQKNQPEKQSDISFKLSVQKHSKMNDSVMVDSSKMLVVTSERELFVSTISPLNHSNHSLEMDEQNYPQLSTPGVGADIYTLAMDPMISSVLSTSPSTFDEIIPENINKISASSLGIESATTSSAYPFVSHQTLPLQDGETNIESIKKSVTINQTSTDRQNGTSFNIVVPNSESLGEKTTNPSKGSSNDIQYDDKDSKHSNIAFKISLPHLSVPESSLSGPSQDSSSPVLDSTPVSIVHKTQADQEDQIHNLTLQHGMDSSPSLKNITTSCSSPYSNSDYELVLHRLQNGEHGHIATKAMLTQSSQGLMDTEYWYFMTESDIIMQEEKVFAENVHIGSVVMTVYPFVENSKGEFQLFLLYCAYTADEVAPIVKVDQQVDYEDLDDSCDCEILPCECSSSPSLTDKKSNLSNMSMQAALASSERYQNCYLTNTEESTGFITMLNAVPSFQQYYEELSQIFDVYEEEESNVVSPSQNLSKGLAFSLKVPASRLTTSAPENTKLTTAHSKIANTTIPITFKLKKQSMHIMGNQSKPESSVFSLKPFVTATSIEEASTSLSSFSRTTSTNENAYVVTNQSSGRNGSISGALNKKGNHTKPISWEISLKPLITETVTEGELGLPTQSSDVLASVKLTLSNHHDSTLYQRDTPWYPLSENVTEISKEGQNPEDISKTSFGPYLDWGIKIPHLSDVTEYEKHSSSMQNTSVLPIIDIPTETAIYVIDSEASQYIQKSIIC
ncbi:hypothetical protein SK128_002225, partial [Halocaridina rubra]